MESSEVHKLVQHLSEKESEFYYFPGRYAVLLLQRAVGDGASMRDVKASRVGGLLRKPMVKELLTLPADGRVEPWVLEAAWPPEPAMQYRIGFGEWGDPADPVWSQTSRVGKNLVVQLNFGSRHESDYHRLFRGVDECPFSFSDHPVARNGQQTLAWSRVDLDLDAGEALIEEVQNDWLREALDWGQWVRRLKSLGQRRGRQRRKWLADEYQMEPRQLEHYVREVLHPHFAVWDEAVLAATLEVLWKELGIRRVYYHTWLGGFRIKQMGCAPPRSLYTSLPRRFCFERVRRGPEFLYRTCDQKRRELLQDPELRWFRLEI